MCVRAEQFSWWMCRGCHLRIASVKMIDPSPAERSIKVHCYGATLALCSHSSQTFCWWRRWQSYSCLLRSCRGWRARIQLAQTTRNDGLNRCFCWTSARYGCVIVCEGEAERESYSYYRWITKCQLRSVPVKVVNMSLRRCCVSKSRYCIWLSGNI